MKITLAILLNAGLLAVLLPWLRRQWREAPAWGRAALVLGLGLRLAHGIITGQTLDANYMSQYGRLLTAQLWAEPAAALRTFMGNELHYVGQELIFYGMSNTFFFVKLLALLNLASLSTDWLNAVYCSIFSFVGCWQLVRALQRALLRTPPAAAVMAFILWPSVVFWGSGVTKESVVIGSGTWLLAVFVQLFFGSTILSPGRWWAVFVCLLPLVVLHFKMRYFFAMPLLGVLGGVATVQALKRIGVVRRRGAQASVLVAVLGSSIWLVLQLSKTFSMNKFTNQVITVYTFDIAHSVGRPHLEYPDLRPTGVSIAAHAPLAAANALTRPWLGESWEPLYVAAALENVALLALLALAGWATVRSRSGRLPFSLGLGLVVFCLVLVFLIGLTTPNLGSLHRYRSGMLPYLLLLLFQNDYAADAFRRLGLGSWSRS